MHQSVERMIRNQEQIVKHFNEQVISVNKELLKGQQDQSRKAKETESLMKMVYEQLQSRKKLKESLVGLPPKG